MESFNSTGVHTLQKEERRLVISFLGGEKEVEPFCAALDIKFKKFRGTFGEVLTQEKIVSLAGELSKEMH